MAIKGHQTDIHAYALDLLAALELEGVEKYGCVDLYDWINEQLELKIWRTSDHSSIHPGWKAEILLTFGGANVSIDLDSRYDTSTLHHSWGAKANGEAQTSIEFYSTALHEAIAEIIEATA